MTRILGFALVAWLVAGAAVAQTLTLKGLDGREVVVTADEMAAMTRLRLRTSWREPVVYEGVPLGALLAKAGAPQGTELRGRAFSIAVVIRAKDGYVTVIALAEVDPATRPEPVIIADRRLDGPLTAEEAPFRLIVGGDLRPGRSARAIERIELRDLR